MIAIGEGEKYVRKYFLESIPGAVSGQLWPYTATGTVRSSADCALQLLFDEISVFAADMKSLPGILWRLLLFAAAGIMCHGIDFAVNYLYGTYNMTASYGMSRNVNSKVYSAKAIAFERTEFLEKVNKAYRGTKSIRKFIDTWMLILLLYLPETAVILMYLYRASPYLPLIFLLILLSSAAVLRLHEKEYSAQEEVAANLQRKIDLYHKLAFDIRNINRDKSDRI